MTGVGEWDSIFDPVDLVPESTVKGRQDEAWGATSGQSEDQAGTDLAPPPALLYPNVAAWVDGWLLPTYRRKIHTGGAGSTWCPEWWRHAEALVRLSALWRGFEQRRTEPGDSMSAWLRDHLDHHLPLILNEQGPLNGCSMADGHSAKMVPLAAVKVPTALAEFI